MITSSEDKDLMESWYYDGGAPLFIVLVSIKALIAMIGVAGNSIVIYASIKDRQSIVRSFRYLNRVVRSLAIADFIYSLVGQPFDILYWYYEGGVRTCKNSMKAVRKNVDNLTEIGPEYRKDGKTWILSLMTVPQDMTAGVSCFHIALIVLLRCLCLIQPMTFDKLHNRLSNIFIVGIWVSMAVFTLCPVVTAYVGITKGEEKHNLHYTIAVNVEAFVTIALPILLNIIFSCLKIFYLRKRRNAKESDNEINSSRPTITFDSKRKTHTSTPNQPSRSSRHKALERMTKVVALWTLICYTPDIIFRLYLTERLRQNLKIYDQNATGIVLFYFFAKLGIQIAKIINPFIYATTIPQFKKLATKYFQNCLTSKNDDPKPNLRLNSPDASRSNFSTYQNPSKRVS